MVAMFCKMLEDDRRRAGWSVGQTAWRLGIAVREYREIEAGARSPNFETWDRICKTVRLAADLRERTMSDASGERAVVLFLRLWLVVTISIAVVSVSAVVLVWLRLPRVLVIAPIGAVIWSASLARVGLACLRLQRAGQAPRIVEGRLTLEVPAEVRRSFIVAIIGAAIIAVGALLAVGLTWTREHASPFWAPFMALFATLAAASVAWLPLTIRRNWTHFEADARGLRTSGPLRSSVELPWPRIASLEARGPDQLPLRIVAMMTDGREQRIMFIDQSVPLSAEGTSALIEELESLRPERAGAP